MSQPIATLRQNCPFCGKKGFELSRKNIAKSVMIKLACGHTIFQQRLETTLEVVETGKTPEQLEIEECEKYVSEDGKHPYPYQIRSAKFFEACNLNGVMAHEMGVGKMVIEILLIKRNLKQLKPILWVTKAGLKYQTCHELIRWADIVPQIIESSSDMPHPELFPVTIISYDTLRLVRPDISREWEEMNAKHGQEKKVVGINAKKGLGAKKIKWTDEVCAKFKHIVMDECQLIKNTDASRTRAIKKIASAWQRVPMGKPPRIMGLSGTPIKNDASEYAPILHMVNPTVFPSETGFIARDCSQIGDSNRYRLRNPDAFHEKTKGFIQRYTREEVLPELPTINRMFRYAEIPEGDVLTKYRAVVNEFMDFMDKMGNEKGRDSDMIGLGAMTNLLGFFSKMRRLTGTAKVEACMELVEEFLLSTDRKIVIFVHHHETANALFLALEKLMAEAAMDPPLMAMPPFDARRRQEIINEFRGVSLVEQEDGTYKEVATGTNHRVMIASTQAVGEGFNLQFCSDCVIMERQWNPSNEEQAEARFPRPGTLLTNKDKINCIYVIAAGTIDDFITELVERKRSNVAQILDNETFEWEESSLMVELANILHVKGLKKWTA